MEEECRHSGNDKQGPVSAGKSGFEDGH
jgi:hypothetical protein